MSVYPNVRLLIVGMNAHDDAEQKHFVGLMGDLEKNGIDWWYGCMAVPSFRTALAMLAGCISLELVHVYRGESYTLLTRDCTALANILAMHQKHPWLNLNGAGFNFLRPILGGRAHVRIGTLENVAAERWKLFGPNQRINEQF